MTAVTGQQRGALKYATVPWVDTVKDPRDAHGRRHGHLGMLNLLVANFVRGKTTLEQAANLAQDVGGRIRKALRLPSSIAGSTLWRLLAQQLPEGLRETLQSQARQLVADTSAPRVLPVGVATFDGKSLLTTHEETVTGLDAVASDTAATPLWRLGAMRAVLTHLLSAPCIDLEFIGAKEGESPAFRVMFPRVVKAMGDTFDIITADAGLTAAENATLVRAHHKHYLFGLKGNQPTLYKYAIDSLALKQCHPRARTSELAHGCTVERELWLHPVAQGDTDFPEARLIILVRQRHFRADELTKEEYRYFVTSVNTTFLDAQGLLLLVRTHWAIENRHNWSLDVVLREDDTQPCKPTRQALEVVAWLRAIALNILSSWRILRSSRPRRLITWDRACEIFRDALVFPAHRRLAASPTPS